MSGEPNDQAQYDALEREMSQPDPALSNFAAGDPEPGLQPERQEYQPAQQRQPDPQPQAAPQQYQQPAQSYRPNVPSADDDPIGHFDYRARSVEARQHALEAGVGHQTFWDNLRQDETRARSELEESDYDGAADHLKTHRLTELGQQFPDNSREAQARAYQYGFRSPAELRMAILQNDVMLVAQAAVAAGRSPAADFYDLARARGYQSTTRIPAGIRKAMVKVAERGSDDEFDKMFDFYAKQSR